MVLPEEEVYLTLEDLHSIKNVDRQVHLEVTGVDFYQKESKKVLALQVKSQEIMIIRENLGLLRNPEKLQLHISLYEKDV